MRGIWIALACVPLAAQEPKRLPLAEAEAIALKNHPRIAAARLVADAAGEVVNQTRAALRPFVAANVVGSVAENDSRWGASGNINPSSLFSRTATGVNISQTLFDFGRTRALTAAAQSRASAQTQNAAAVRAEILLRVREAYYRMLLAEVQHRVAGETVGARRVTLKQISALAESNLRSTLDVSFAELAVSEAELALDRAENERRAAMVQLAAALGYSDEQRFAVEEQPDPDALPDSADDWIAQALRTRPELASLRLEAEAARHIAENERRQALPTVSATGVGGVLGFRDDRLRPHYGALGVNLNIPVFNGNLFSSRQREATLRSESLLQQLREMEVRVARDVRTAWIDARNAHGRLPLTARVLEQASKTLRLAQSRYDLGLSSIVELSQAQLARTSAEVGAAAARYEYLVRRAILEYHAARF